MVYGQTIQSDILKSLINDFKAFDSQTLSVTTTAQKLTVPTGTRYALCQVESDVTDGKAIRFWLHGAAPTSSTGFYRGAGDAFDIIDAQNIHNASFIQGTAGITTLIVQYFK